MLERQVHDEVRSVPDLGLDLNMAAVFLDDAVADAQAQARPLAQRLGGEEGVKNAVPNSRINTVAVVLDVDLDAVLRRPGANDHPAPLGAGVDGVGHQVEYDLINL